MKKSLIIKILSVEIVLLSVLFVVFIIIIVNEAANAGRDAPAFAASPVPEKARAEVLDAKPDANAGKNVFRIPDFPESPPDSPPNPAAPNQEIASPVTIAFGGDILIDSGVKQNMYDGGRDAVLPLSHAYPFTQADIAVVNMEFPLSLRGTPMPDKEFTFRGDPQHISFFTEMGVDLATLANNHIIDYGYDAFSDTLDLLNENGIKYIGAGIDKSDAMRYEIFEVSGKKIAFLNASRVIPVVDWYASSTKPGVFGTYDPAELNAQIVLAKENADYVIVCVHWGVEKSVTPVEYQVNMAKGYIDNGADAVIGSHPHVLQGFEYYKNKPIAYSLGNFVFTDINKNTMAITLTLTGGEVPQIKIIPYHISNRKTTLMENEDDKLALKAHLEEISFGVTIDDEWIVRANGQ
ncbi:MAG: CapA family protein [Clostridiales bacterium]|jgi:poly-gamma-glutamate synthesis protein (capsule biosynthesis protein)|nr:CapA family protein [Clostridiales bacterium]